MENGEKNGNGKLPWEIPRIVAIPLTAEEVLAVGCKQPHNFAVGGRPSCGLGVPCVTRGS